MKRLPIKQPGEAYIHDTDFAPLMALGEDVAEITLTRKILKTLTGAPATAGDANSVAPTALASADSALVSLMSGSHNHVYHIDVKIRTNLGNYWHEDLILPVWDTER